MRYINLETWPRREHFKFFSTFDQPHVGMCANVDLTAFYPSAFACMVEYAEDYAAFAARAAERIAFVKEHPWVNKSQRADVLYMTAIPWVSFTSFMHPMHLQPADSVPRFAWGKFFEQGNSLTMPLGVQDTMPSWMAYTLEGSMPSCKTT